MTSTSPPNATGIHRRRRNPAPTPQSRPQIAYTSILTAHLPHVDPAWLPPPLHPLPFAISTRPRTVNAAPLRQSTRLRIKQPHAFIPTPRAHSTRPRIEQRTRSPQCRALDASASSMPPTSPTQRALDRPPQLLSAHPPRSYPRQWLPQPLVLCWDTARDANGGTAS
ncbi:hypothetical protein B0H16DRAFT_1504409 [Mycena metata]|uniref:Uncharacterized protein n=1 Tax=Mycena metata TaxID=1033252 RepID=A0AAD7K335_9AGAR|nr:hypothetical protein B0H16DRAFT_1504409 [Mycena metata]